MPVDARTEEWLPIQLHIASPQKSAAGSTKKKKTNPKALSSASHSSPSKAEVLPVPGTRITVRTSEAAKRITQAREAHAVAVEFVCFSESEARLKASSLRLSLLFRGSEESSYQLKAAEEVKLKRQTAMETRERRSAQGYTASFSLKANAATGYRHAPPSFQADKALA
ncbi:hypothetical protein BESB_037750 [Besnoitia besnoiti]|uniref:Uncharacterized protein n=1 Tax=Besnoitia besnoiti TaxID=94643 RepID=A0A2A9MN94_BESBE|nr:hypothetical protein BESB_037750 [Besnoitia besnoiti]PFH37317.1 hypothetical protein BESB_037750 [Besnoitia besnoiti]